MRTANRRRRVGAAPPFDGLRNPHRRDRRQHRRIGPQYKVHAGALPAGGHCQALGLGRRRGAGVKDLFGLGPAAAEERGAGKGIADHPADAEHGHHTLARRHAGQPVLAAIVGGRGSQNLRPLEAHQSAWVTRGRRRIARGRHLDRHARADDRIAKLVGHPARHDPGGSWRLVLGDPHRKGERGDAGACHTSNQTAERPDWLAATSREA